LNQKKNVFKVSIYHLDLGFKLIELQYWSDINNIISFTQKITFPYFPIKLVLCAIFLFKSKYQQYNLHEYMLYKRDRMTMKNRASVIFSFKNKSGLHSKVNRQDTMELLFKVALNTINQAILKSKSYSSLCVK